VPAAVAGRPARLNPVLTVAALLAVALVTWIVTFERMRGMDEGPGTDLGGLGWFIGVWVTMTAAMMLPSTAPMALVVRTASARRGRGGRPAAPATTALFLAGYLAAWTAYGLAAYGAFRVLDAHHPALLAWGREGPVVAGAAVIAAGAYQLTPLKRACLRHCRTPLHFVMHRWREGAAGAFAMGLEHGAWCLGCCLGLMLALFAVGVMSLAWMAVVALVIFAEKVLPGGARLTAPVAVCLVALGALIAVAPGRVPGLTEPGMTRGMSMEQASSHVA
jgi:predicted metal-binding membrane protein